MSKTIKKRETVLKGLDQISEAAMELNLSIPQLRSIPTLTELDGTLAGKVKAVGQIQEDVANALKFIRDASRRIAGCKNRLERKIVAGETEKPMAEMRKYLSEVLGLQDKVLKATAAVTYMKESFSQQFSSYEETRAMLAELIECGLLVQDGDGRVLIAYQHYKIGEAFGLDKDDEAEVSEIVAKFSRVLMTLENQRRQAQTKEMEAEAEIDLDSARTGENGKCLLRVPPESYVDKRGDGKEHWRGGGKILLDFQEREVAPLRASGSIEGLVIQLVEMDVRIGRHTLGWSNPPGCGKAFQRVAEAVQDDLGLSDAEAETYVRKMQSLWYLIQRGIRASDEEKARAEKKNEMSNRADITAQQFFGLNGAGQPCNGTALLQFQGKFKQPDDTFFFDPFFLATRGEEEGKGFFEVTESPPHLQDLLGQYVGKRFPISDDYRNCPDQLGRLIRAVKGQEEMAVANGTAEEEQ